MCVRVCAHACVCLVVYIDHRAIYYLEYYFPCRSQTICDTRNTREHIQEKE